MGFSLAKRMVTGYLRQPYEWFLNQHSANIGKTVLSEVDAVINSSLRPIMEVIARSLICVMLIVLLIWVDPVVALIAGFGLGGSYGLIYSRIRQKIRELGKQRVEANRERFTAINETFGGIKDIKVAGLEGSAAFRFRGPARRFARARASLQVTSTIPPLAMEAMIMVGFVGVILFYLRDMQQMEEKLPVLSLYGLAVFRLKPSLQQLFTSFVTLRFSSAALDSLHESLASLDTRDGGALSRTPPQPLGMKRELELKHLSFSYQKTNRPAVKDVSLQVPVNAAIGLIGSTGSGKTTLVDIILGLLKPQQGQLLVDGEEITSDNVRKWQRSIGYVPQHISLGDVSVAENIAFGLTKGEFDQEAVERAAKVANLHEFVVNELPLGYDTVIGERGVRLSGGQRQRIGIARAMYHDPEILILDEATSALDNLTERAVMEAVQTLSHKKTIILIAHRLSTVQNCDCIYMLEQGKLVAQGDYVHLLETNERFQSLAGG